LLSGDTLPEAVLPNLDSLAFDIKFALRREAIGDHACELIRGLSDDELALDVSSVT